MNNPSFTHWPLITVAILLLAVISGCGALRPTATPLSTFYTLDNAQLAAKAEAKSGLKKAVPPSDATQTLIINPPQAAAGFDSQRIIYVRESHKLEYFAHSEWADTPARMLAPLLATALENSGAYRAVVLTPSAATGDMRLDTEIIRLQHEFGIQPSRVRFTLRAHLVDIKTRRVLAWREFDATVPAASEDPYGGVVAANRAVQVLLEKLAALCAEAVRSTRMVQ